MEAPQRPQLLETTVLAIDPSTRITGAAVVRGTAGYSEVVAAWSYDAGKGGDSLEARYDRMVATMRALRDWAGNLPCAIDVIAFEQDFFRGQAATSAVLGATGLYVGMLRYRLKCPLLSIPVQSVRSEAGVKRGTPREQSKPMVILAANSRHNLSLGPHQDAEADAIMVGNAALRRIGAAEAAKSQKVLPGMKGKVRAVK